MTSTLLRCIPLLAACLMSTAYAQQHEPPERVGIPPPGANDVSGDARTLLEADKMRANLERDREIQRDGGAIPPVKAQPPIDSLMPPIAPAPTGRVDVHPPGAAPTARCEQLHADQQRAERAAARAKGAQHKAARAKANRDAKRAAQRIALECRG